MATAADRIEDSRFPKGAGFLLTLLIIAELTVASDFSLASIALPSIERGLHLEPVLSQWIITADLLAYAGFLIIAGRLADIYGQKRTLMVGMTIFLTGTLLASLSTSAPMLIGARIVQGIGGAFSYPAAFSLLTISFREGPQRFRAYTINMAAASTGVPLVTMFVGWAITRLGWQSAFLFNVPMCIIVLVGLSRLPLPRPAQPATMRKIPVVDALLLTSGIAAILYALTGFVANHAASTGSGPYVLIVGLLILVLFAFIQRRSVAPLISPALLRLPNFIAGIFILSLIVLTGKAMIVLSNISLQRGLQFTPVQASLMLLPMVLSSLALIPLSARLDRYLLPYARWAICGAFIAACLFYMTLSQIGSQAAAAALIVILFLSPFASITGANLALNTILRKVPAGSQGVATAITYTMVQIVTASGMAVIIAASGRSKAGAGYFESFSNSFLIGAALCLLGLCLTAFTLLRQKAGPAA